MCSPPSLLPFGSKIVYIGDSITEHGSFASASQVYNRPRGYVTWSQIYSDHRCFIGADGNAGIGGQTTVDMISRYMTDVIAKNPAIVVMLMGTNDIAFGVTTDDTKANIQSMLNANDAIGALTILIKILPRRPNADPMNADMMAKWVSINDWIGTKASATVTVLDLENVIGTMSGNHSMINGMQTLNEDILLHPNPVASRLIGMAVATQINTMVDSGSVLFSTYNDPNNLNTNGFFKGGGAYLADGYEESSNLGGATNTLSRIERTTGLGYWQQMAINGNYSGTGKYARIRRQIDLTGKVNAGDTIELVNEVRCGLMGNAISAMRKINLSNGQMIAACNHDGIMNYMPENWMGTMRSPPLLITSNIGVIYDTFVVYLMDTNSTLTANATVRFGRAGIRKL